MGGAAWLSIFGLGKASTRKHIRPICDRGATQPKTKSDATHRARALRGVWRRCPLLTDPCGYARHSRLASHHKLLLRGPLLFMRCLLVSLSLIQFVTR